MNTKAKILILVVIYLALSFVSLYRHKNVELNSFRSEVYADRAGYYVYLPATFIYHFNTEKFPGEIEKNTGNGFRIDSLTQKIITKYTYGVSLMQLPFFLIADVITSIQQVHPRDGFSYYYQKSVDFAGVFYLVGGLYLLFLVLNILFPHSKKTIIIGLTMLFLGTNLYYYGIVEAGMSHIYSFFLFSALIYLTVTHRTDYGLFRKVVFPVLVVSLIVIIRPINIIGAGFILFYNKGFFVTGFKSMSKSNTSKALALALLTGVVVFAPQLIYWKYAFGSFVSYSYGQESFTHWLNPSIIKVLFSPANGLVPYSLIIVFIVAGIFMMVKKKDFRGIVPLMYFVLVIYITASWHDWKFGCGCGMRNMVEYYSFLSFPLIFFLQKINSIEKILPKVTLWFFIAVLVLISFKVNYHYYGCYFETDWSWGQYFKALQYPFNQ